MQTHSSQPRGGNLLRRRGVLVMGAASAAALTATLVFERVTKTTATAPRSGESKDVLIEQFDADGKSLGTARVERVVKSETDWRKALPPISFEVTRRAGTEYPFTGATWNEHADGIYHCICCDTFAFDARAKFESGTGWPSFWQPVSRLNIVESDDYSLGVYRTAISCRRCDAHLGHLFNDGPKPTGQRYCMNSAAMRFVARPSVPIKPV